jgi:hypothetical protein
MRNGFEIFPDLFRAAELDDIARELDAAPVNRSRAGARHLLRSSGIAKLARDSRLIGLAAGVLGGAPRPFGATLFDKSADANWLVSWHQDTALSLSERIETQGWGPWSEKGGVTYAHAPATALERVVALRLHLDDSTADNGPLRVLPATHTLGVLSDGAMHALARKGQASPCLVARGGVLAMRPLLIHASSKVKSNQPRRVIHIEYAAADELAPGLRLRFT